MTMCDEDDLIFSSLQRTLTEGHRWVKVSIYRILDGELGQRGLPVAYGGACFKFPSYDPSSPQSS